jgi:hypothetical protein
VHTSLDLATAGGKDTAFLGANSDAEDAIAPHIAKAAATTTFFIYIAPGE